RKIKVRHVATSRSPIAAMAIRPQNIVTVIGIKPRTVDTAVSNTGNRVRQRWGLLRQSMLGRWPSTRSCAKRPLATRPGASSLARDRQAPLLPGDATFGTPRMYDLLDRRCPLPDPPARQ